MLDQPPLEPPAAIPAPVEAQAAGADVPQTDKLVIDILAPASRNEDCAGREPDPFFPEILVCQQAALSQRLTRPTGPEVDDFGNAIPRARIKLSENAQADANLINKDVGGFNANGGEVRLKIDF